MADLEKYKEEIPENMEAIDSSVDTIETEPSELDSLFFDDEPEDDSENESLSEEEISEYDSTTETSSAKNTDSEQTAINRTPTYLTRREEFNSRQEFKSSLGLYLTALKRHTILQGVIAGVDEDESSAYWICFDNDIIIRIPFKNAYVSVPSDLLNANNRETLNRQRQLLSSAIGAKILFTVTSISTDNNCVEVIASRTRAMASIRQRYFGPNATTPLALGSEIQVQVLSIGRYVAYLTGFGMDFRITNSNLTYRYMDSISQYFAPGDLVNMKIIKLGETNNPVSHPPVVELSARDIEMRKYQKITRNLKRNSRWAATVRSLQKLTNKNGDPRIIVHLWLHTIGVPAISSTLMLRTRENLHTGDKVMFEVKGCTASGMPHGVIARYIKPR